MFLWEFEMGKFLRKYVLFFSLGFLLGCPGNPITPVSTFDSDAAASICEKAEAKLLELKCTYKTPDGGQRLLGGPNLRDVGYSTVCFKNMKNGADMDATCIANANSCEEVEKC
jgi:hypothetical protein